MHVSPLSLNMIPALNAFYNALVAAIPHCYPVSPDLFAATLTPCLDGTSSHKNLRDEAMFVATEGRAIVGMIHTGIDTGQRPHGPSDEWVGCGAVRCFGYARGHRAAGQALLQRAENRLRSQGATRVVVGHYDHRYPFYHVEHMFVSIQLEPVWSLLGMNGYAHIEHGSQIVLDWTDFDPPGPASLPIEADIALEWIEEGAARPGLIVHATKGDREIGVCVCHSHGVGNPAPEAQDWVYTQWLGIEPEFRGAGLGRYLLQRALHEAHGIGYRHATICSMGNNYRALLFYSNFGYRAVDWSYAWEKALDDHPEEA